MITEAEKEKAVKQFKRQLNGVMSVFHFHGLHIHIPDAIEVITELALLLHKRLNGQDIPVTYEHANEKKRRRYKGG